MSRDGILYPGMTARSPEGRAWWQSDTVEAFTEKIAAMDKERLEELYLEIKATVVRVNDHVGDPERDLGRRRAARRALTHMVTRKRLAAAELSKRKEQKNNKRPELLDAAEEKVAAGDALGAVALVIEALRGNR